MRFSRQCARQVSLLGLALLLFAQSVAAQQVALPQRKRQGRVATPTAVSTGAAPAPVAPTPGAASRGAQDYDQQRLIAGHMLRRMGFGPSPKDLDTVLRMGPSAYIEQQLNPGSIDDSAAEAKLPAEPKSPFNLYPRLRRWYLRMIYSRRQLQEKMTLIWHEHFATSIVKVGNAAYMSEQEAMFRKNALGNFRQLLIEASKDRAMLVWLDNNYNSGTDTDDEGNPIPPNENYGRELLQLFSLGTVQLRLDGTPITDGNGVALPNYTEDDVKAVARALTGWYNDSYKGGKPSRFEPFLHDSSEKTILGHRIAGRSGADGARELEDVVDIIMQHPSTAPFISKTLIQKLATETPTPGYVQRVATVFKQTNGDLKATVRAILTDTEFTSPDVVRTQFKNPIEHFIGPIRALDVKSKGYFPIDATYLSKELIYYPPSVFSFYRPGQKGSLINTSLVTLRDSLADAFVAGYDAKLNVRKVVQKNNLQTPEQIVDYLSDALLTAPLDPNARSRIVAYMDGRTDEEKFRGAIWLIMASPDFQRN